MVNPNYFNLNKTLRNLDESGPKHKQKRAMRKLRKLKKEDISCLIMPRPFNNQDCWKNAALILRDLGYPKIESEIFNLIGWLTDFNCAGAEIIYDLMKTIPKNVLVKNTEKYMKQYPKANRINENFYWISRLIKECDIKIDDFENGDFFKVLMETNTYFEGE